MTEDSVKTMCEKVESKKGFGNRRRARKEVISLLAGDDCRYKIVRELASKKGWKIVEESASEEVKKNCNVYWVDSGSISDYFLWLKPWQCINHFPGMTNIARKTRMARNLECMKKKFPREYAFFPQTYVLPNDIHAFRSRFDSSGKGKNTFIVKPDGGAQGRGIFLTRNLSEINLFSPSVAQSYIRNPLLIENKKFDIRLYLLITSCNPLRLFLFRDGLVRLCTHDFVSPSSDNLDQRCMHLTNYSINKKNSNFIQPSVDDDGNLSSTGSKRTLQWFMQWLTQKIGSQKTQNLWNSISGICVKTIISILPVLQKDYLSLVGPQASSPNNCQKTCGNTDGPQELHKENIHPHTTSQAQTSTSFTSVVDSEQHSVISGSRCVQVLGIDILIDINFKPYLIEVNHLPSFRTDTALDRDIKSRVVQGALSVMKASARDKSIYDSNNKYFSINRLFSNIKTTTSSSEDPSCTLVEDDGTETDQEGSEKMENSSCNSESVYDQILLQEEKILGDSFDRIFPSQDDSKSSSKSCIYSKMIEYISEEYKKQQKRLLNPISRTVHDEKNNQVKEQAKPNQNIKDEIVTTCRRDSWIDGGVHARGSIVKPTATSQQPTKKQLEAVDRLYRGFSVAEVLKKNKFDEVDNTYTTENESSLKISKTRNNIKQKGVAVKPVNFEFYGGYSSLLKPDQQNQVLSDYRVFRSDVSRNANK